MISSFTALSENLVQPFFIISRRRERLGDLWEHLDGHVGWSGASKFGHADFTSRAGHFPGYFQS